jgi:hypothetical protein
MTTRGWVEVELQAFLTAAVSGRDLAASLSCSVTSTDKADVTYWRSGYVGHRSKLDAAAKKKVSPLPAIDLRHSARSLVAMVFIHAVGIYIFLLSICKNGYCWKPRDLFNFTLHGLYLSTTQRCKIPRCQVALPTVLFYGSSNICGSSIRNFLHVIFVVRRILKTLLVFCKIWEPLV